MIDTDLIFILIAIFNIDKTNNVTLWCLLLLLFKRLTILYFEYVGKLEDNQ